MLNKNDHVNILAEPLQPLATKHHKIADKVYAAGMEFQFLVDTMERAGRDPSLRLTGFNEKLIYPKYVLPTQPQALKNISNYFTNNQFRWEYAHRGIAFRGLVWKSQLVYFLNFVGC